jgi:hypothetical protein
MNKRLLAIFSLAFAAGACRANDVTNTSPKPPTVLVTNASCAQGGCRTLEVRAFVWVFRIPQLPTGSMVVGYVPPGQKCLVFPTSLTSTIRGVDSLGRTTDSSSTIWTPNDVAGVYLSAVDSALFHVTQLTQAQADSLNQTIFPFDGYGRASVGSSVTFVPGQHPGWAVSFPNSPIRSASISPDGACTP